MTDGGRLYIEKSLRLCYDKAVIVLTYKESQSSTEGSIKNES